MRIYEADIVSAYRFDRTGEGARRLVYSYVYNHLVQTLFGLRLRDMNFAFKLVRRSVLDHVELAQRGLVHRRRAAGPGPAPRLPHRAVRGRLLPPHPRHLHAVLQRRHPHDPARDARACAASSRRSSRCPPTCSAIPRGSPPTGARRRRVGPGRGMTDTGGPTGRRALLIVNADDYGLTEGVSRAILDAHRDGIVTSTSVLALAPGVRHLGAVAGRRPGARHAGPTSPRWARTRRCCRPARSRRSSTGGAGCGRRGGVPAPGRGRPHRPRRPAARVRRPDRGHHLGRGRRSTTSTPTRTSTCGRWSPTWCSTSARPTACAPCGSPGPPSGARSGVTVRRLAARLEGRLRGAGLALARGLHRARRGRAASTSGPWSPPSPGWPPPAPVSAELATHPGGPDDPERDRYRWDYQWEDEYAALRSDTVRAAVDELGFGLGTFADLLEEPGVKPPRSPAARRVLALWDDAPRGDRFHTAVRWWTAPFAALEREVPLSGDILEVGCGHGVFSTYLAVCSRSRHVVGRRHRRRQDRAGAGGRAPASIPTRVTSRSGCRRRARCPASTAAGDCIVFADVLYLLTRERREALLVRVRRGPGARRAAGGQGGRHPSRR